MTFDRNVVVVVVAETLTLEDSSGFRLKIIISCVTEILKNLLNFVFLFTNQFNSMI